MLGMLSPASRGALMTAAIFLYVFMGLIAGYFSARLYKTMKGREWKRAAFLVSTNMTLVLLLWSFLAVHNGYWYMVRWVTGLVQVGSSRLLVLQPQVGISKQQLYIDCTDWRICELLTATRIAEGNALHEDECGTYTLLDCTKSEEILTAVNLTYNRIFITVQDKL
jgi:hypothetical protein